VWEPDGTIIQLGDMKIAAGRDLTAEEIQSIVKSMLSHARETTSDDTDETKGDAYNRLDDSAQRAGKGDKVIK